MGSYFPVIARNLYNNCCIARYYSDNSAFKKSLEQSGGEIIVGLPFSEDIEACDGAGWRQENGAKDIFHT